MSGVFLSTLAVVIQAIAWSLVFSRMNEAENLLRKSCQVPKFGGFLLRAAYVSVRDQRAADPSLMNERAYAIFLSSSLYVSLLTRRYNCTLLNHPLAFSGVPSKAGGCPSFSSCGFCVAEMVDAVVDGWLLILV